MDYSLVLSNLTNPTLLFFILGIIAASIRSDLEIPATSAKFISLYLLFSTVLASSASYIAVPAALRLAVPQADPGYYIPMALAITFPFNIVVGIPLYYGLLSIV